MDATQDAVTGLDGDDPDQGQAESLARQVVLRRLSYAPQTRTQLEQALARKGVPAETAAAVLDRFGEVGLVDDAAYARAWVESRHAGRGLARRSLGHELRERGIAEQTVEAALALVDPADEERAAHALVRRRLSGLADRPREVQVRRLLAMLARRGYPGVLADRVVQEELRGCPPGRSG